MAPSTPSLCSWRTLRRLGACLVLVAPVIGLAACRPDADGASAPRGGPASSVAEVSTTTSTTTPAPTSTEPPPAPPPSQPEPDPTLVRAPEDVAALQHHLMSLGYRIDLDGPGEYGPGTSHAVMAFQKLHGLQRDGIAGPDTQEALATAEPVEPRYGRHPHIEVDLAAQVVIVVDGAGGVSVLDATSGAPATPTPVGSFEILRSVDGWDPGPWGALYRPRYFVGGVAFHGGYPVLSRPASHGCVRLPDPAVDWLWSSGVAARGTIVDVY